MPSKITEPMRVGAEGSFKDWWAGLDSNQRRRKPADLQSAPFGHFGTYPRRERLI